MFVVQALAWDLAADPHPEEFRDAVLLTQCRRASVMSRGARLAECQGIKIRLREYPGKLCCLPVQFGWEASTP